MVCCHSHFDKNLELREGKPWSKGHIVEAMVLKQRLPDSSGFPNFQVIRCLHPPGPLLWTAGAFRGLL